MHATPATTLKRRLASIHDSTHKNQLLQQQSPSITRGTPQAAFAAQSKTPASKTAAAAATNGNDSVDKPGYIDEDYLSFLSGGPYNRFALALKSNLENEIDWACTRLVPATHQAPEAWSIVHYAPFLVEAILGVLERSRKELAHCSSGGARANDDAATRKTVAQDIKSTILADSGPEMAIERASERSRLLATALFNIAQVGNNAEVMALDPRITLEIAQWLQTFHDDSLGHTAVKANLLDLLDILLPVIPQPPFDSAPIRVWPTLGSRESAALDPLALVEACLWEELVYILCESRERTLVLGSMRVLVQSISWHPQLARELLDLPVPKRHVNATQECVGEMINDRLAELLLAPGIDIVSACFELMLNTVRIESMANALDAELEAFATKNLATSPSYTASSRNDAAADGGWRRRKRLRNSGFGSSEPPSGGDSGTQTPIFGFRPLSRASSSMGADLAATESEPSALPDGLTALVSLVSQQWLSAACPPQPSPPPPEASLKALKGLTTLPGNKDAGSSHGSSNKQSTSTHPNKPPTEPELREACTWALLNYEFVPPSQAQQQPLAVRLAEVYRRYMIAKQGQTVPRIGRALTLAEMARVIAAVFPHAPLRGANNQPQQGGQPAPVESLAAFNLRPKSQHIIPIPAVAVDASKQQEQEQQGGGGEQKQSEKRSGPNMCLWHGCQEHFESEEAALAHISGHTKGTDACRWKNCNRIPGGAVSEAAGLEKWIARHVLIHGPFYKALKADKPNEDAAAETTPAGKNRDSTDAVPSPDVFLLAKQIREEKTHLLNAISPLFSGESPQSDQSAQQQVLKLVLQGIGVVEQLQKWADRRGGRRGELDRLRVWKSGDDVLERIAFIAGQSTPVAIYASRLLAVLTKTNVI
ncbi:hypothetical protein GGI12_001392 [Dipsacomyces acuminosporus]|nr:hypothetical protein GGI12_001392 [Dipsacomyces acuminosporus]